MLIKLCGLFTQYRCHPRIYVKEKLNFGNKMEIKNETLFVHNRVLYYRTYSTVCPKIMLTNSLNILESFYDFSLANR